MASEGSCHANSRFGLETGDSFYEWLAGRTEERKRAIDKAEETIVTHDRTEKQRTKWKPPKEGAMTQLALHIRTPTCIFWSRCTHT